MIFFKDSSTKGLEAFGFKLRGLKFSALEGLNHVQPLFQSPRHFLPVFEGHWLKYSSSISDICFHPPDTWTFPPSPFDRERDRHLVSTSSHVIPLPFRSSIMNPKLPSISVHGRYDMQSRQRLASPPTRVVCPHLPTCPLS